MHFKQFLNRQFFMISIDFRWFSLDFEDFGLGLIFHQIANLKGSTYWLFSVPETTLQCVLTREVARKHCRNMLECILNSFWENDFSWFSLIFIDFRWFSLDFENFGPGLIFHQIANLKGSTYWLCLVPETTLQRVLSHEMMRNHCRNMLECILNNFWK